jgi:hypothetical protein
MAAVFDQGIFDSFDVALVYFDNLFRPATTASFAAPRIGGFDLRLTRSLAPLADVRASAIPVDAIGKTYVYDANTNVYRPDPDATGAPPTGVRFILYTWDNSIGYPGVPVARVGYVDIVQVSTGTTSPELNEVVIVRDSPRLVVADFVTMHGTSATATTFGIEGSATDATTTVQIAVDATQTGPAGQHHLVINSALSSLGIGSTERLTSDQGSATGGGKLELNYDGHRLTLESAATGSEVKFDGRLYARIVPSTPPADPQYLKPDGTSLTQAEIADLNALILRVLAVNFYWINLSFF